MAQLKDDCFAFSGGLIPLGQALDDLRSRLTTVVGTETVPLINAIGRILAEDIKAGLRLGIRWSTNQSAGKRIGFLQVHPCPHALTVALILFIWKKIVKQMVTVWYCLLA